MLKNKTALVTGSTSGIGLAIAKAFAENGANVVINGLGDSDEIESIRSSIENEFETEVHYSPANMLEPKQIFEMIAECITKFGSLDILVNNAGIQHVSPIEDFPVEKWDDVIAINLSSSFHTIRAAVPNMKESGWGRIINTASAHALVASPYKAAYVAAKHGIAGLTKTIALEVAELGITVNAICPGYVWTPLVEAQIPDTMKTRNLSEEEVKREVLLKAQPTKKFISVEQVAGMAVFLCSETAASVTGALLSMDGGWCAQ